MREFLRRQRRFRLIEKVIDVVSPAISFVHLIQKRTGESMFLNHENQPSKLQLIWRRLEFSIERVLQALRFGNEELADFDLAHEGLGRIPFPQDEFALAKRRLHNAQQYCGRGETGAAIYEINLLYAVVRREAACAKTPQSMTSFY
jgi:hypothetical protein